MLTHGSYPLYSLDANALIDFRPFRPAVFPSMWKLVEDTVDDGRLLMCEEAARECRDAELQQFIRTHQQQMVVDIQYTHDYLARLQLEAPRHGIQLVDPGRTTNQADPFVVALALMLEQRDLKDLRRKTNPAAKCAVVTHERPKGPGAKWVKIPNVCTFYGLECIDWQEFLMREGYRG